MEHEVHTPDAEHGHTRVRVEAGQGLGLAELVLFLRQLAAGQAVRIVTADEVAEVLRTSRTAVYAMVARGQLPGVTRIGRRVLFRSDDLLDWLDQKRAPSPKE